MARCIGCDRRQGGIVLVNGILTLAMSLEMDSALLWLTSRFLGIRLSRFRIAVGAAVGTLPTLWVLLTQNLYSVPWGIAIIWPTFMLTASFAPLPRRYWFTSYVALLCGTVLAAGIGLFMVTWATHLFPDVSVIVWLLVALPMVLLGIAWWLPVWRRTPSDVTGEIRLVLEDKRLSVRVLWDSGNQLRDPVLRRPVVVLDTNSVIEWLPEDILGWVVDTTRGQLTAPPPAWRDRLGVISFHSLGGNGRLPIVAVDYAEGYLNGRWYRLVPVFAGFSANPVAGDGAYQALCNPSAVTAMNQEAMKEGVGA